MMNKRHVFTCSDRITAQVPKDRALSLCPSQTGTIIFFEEAPAMRNAFAPLVAALLTLGIVGADANAQVVYGPSSQEPGVQLLDSWYRHYLGRPADQTAL